MLCGSAVTPVNTTISIRVTAHTDHNLDTDDSPRTRQPNRRHIRPACGPADQTCDPAIGFAVFHWEVRDRTPDPAAAPWDRTAVGRHRHSGEWL
ncbi:hypothetical protein IFM12275_12960 [Nocardia sputorum]|nr:hypothetical protein IFM12275_12960 [Nocardia sputorum]